MASPAVVTTTTDANAAQEVTFAINLPASLVADNLLVLKLRIDDRDASDPTLPAGYTIFLNTIIDSATARTLCIWKKLTGSEGATFNVTNGSTASRSSAIAYQISGAADPTVQPPEANTPATATSANANATILTPTGGSKDYLFVVGVATSSATSATPPTGYGSRITASNGTGQGIATASRALTAASDDPGNWALSPSGVWLATLVAIHPPAAAAPATGIGAYWAQQYAGRR